MAKNQHNFMLIENICANKMHDMEMGEIPWDGDEYDRLQARKDRAAYFFCWSSPIGWLTWEEWQDAKEISVSAVLHREEKCIEAGRYDLIQYC